MIDEMSMMKGHHDCEFDSTNCIIDLSYLGESEFSKVDFVICMNPRLSNNQKLKIKYTLKGKLRNAIPISGSSTYNFIQNEMPDDS